MESTIFEFSIFTSAEPEAMVAVPMVALLFSVADEEAEGDADAEAMAPEAMMRSEMVAWLATRLPEMVAISDSRFVICPSATLRVSAAMFPVTLRSPLMATLPSGVRIIRPARRLRGWLAVG